MGLIPDQIIDQVIDRCDIVETIGGYVHLKKAGRSFKANCPFHNEKTPSFIVNPEKQIFHCFGCGVGGNVISFIMKHERLEFPEAIRMLAQKVNIEIPATETTKNPHHDLREQIFQANALAVEYFHRILLADKSPLAKQARDYLKERNVSLDTAREFFLGYAVNEWEGLLNYLKSKDLSLGLMEKAGLIIPRGEQQGFYDRFRHRIIFPIFDSRSRCCAFGGRVLESSDDKTAKYINSPETNIYTKGEHLYGFHLTKQAIGQQDSAIIVEGYMDCVIPYQYGVKNIVAALGTALTVEQIRLLRRYTKNVILLFDMDPAGERAMMRSLDILIEEGMVVKVANLDEGSDPDSFIRENGLESFQKHISDAQSIFDYKLKILRRQADEKTAEGKAAIIHEMLLTIIKYENAVIQSEYLKKLAAVLRVDEQALRTELKKIAGQKRTPSRFETAVQRVSTEPTVHHERHPRKAEYSILKILLEEREYILSTKKDVPPEEFQDVRIRQVITKIYDWAESGKPITLNGLLNSFDNPQIHDMLSRLSSEEYVRVTDQRKMYEDLITWMKKDRLKNMRRDIVHQIQEAEQSGDHHRVDDLKTKFNQLIQKG